ncbi:hypothetical protein DC082_06260 [Ignatzschineria indica]|uniref:Uncharacterized protein n=1 Tax=Ignatzschineria indica TaxID=472583 RepID=A0A2U2AJN0_9GAMM|nr:hypothetical protein DC082_06260 [Ignatzschineria indica]
MSRLRESRRAGGEDRRDLSIKVEGMMPLWMMILMLREICCRPYQSQYQYPSQFQFQSVLYPVNKMERPQ